MIQALRHALLIVEQSKENINRILQHCNQNYGHYQVISQVSSIDNIALALLH